MVGGKQQISLSLYGSSYGSAIHEIGHAVGLIHEQCRNDRDSYITIHTSNIESGKSIIFQNMVRIWFVMSALLILDRLCYMILSLLVPTISLR